MKFVPKMNFDLAVNIAILVTCAALLGAVVRRHEAAVGRSSRPPVQMIKSGDRAETLAGVSYSDARATLVLHVKSSCMYCTQSMEFYRRVREVTRQRQGVRFVVVGIESAEVLGRYLSQHGVTADRVISHPGAQQPTPTLLLVDDHGVVRDVWLGLQNPEGEQQVLSRIGRAPGLAAGN